MQAVLPLWNLTGMTTRCRGGSGRPCTPETGTASSPPAATSPPPAATSTTSNPGTNTATPAPRTWATSAKATICSSSTNWAGPSANAATAPGKPPAPTAKPTKPPAAHHPDPDKQIRPAARDDQPGEEPAGHLTLLFAWLPTSEFRHGSVL